MGLVSILGQANKGRTRAIGMHLFAALVIGALFVGIFVSAQFAESGHFVVLVGFFESEGGIVAHHLDIVVHQPAVDMDELISD